MVPAPGQGALALQARQDGEAFQLAAVLDDPETRAAVELETRFLKKMGGGCDQPLGAYAAPEGTGWTVRLFHSELDGRNPRWKTLTAVNTEQAAQKVDAYSDSLLAHDVDG